MTKPTQKILAIYMAAILPILTSTPVMADTPGVSQVEGFIKGIITSVAGLAGVVASGFFVVGGFRYITSSGKPQHLEHAKRTIVYSAAGLAITIAAFVLSNIVSNLASSAFGSQ
jgi:hypothetical protein